MESGPDNCSDYKSLKFIPAAGPCPLNTECWYCDIEDALVGTEELRDPDDCQLAAVDRPVTALDVEDGVLVTLIDCEAAELICC